CLAGGLCSQSLSSVALSAPILCRFLPSPPCFNFCSIRCPAAPFGAGHPILFPRERTDTFTQVSARIPAYFVGRSPPLHKGCWWVFWLACVAISERRPVYRSEPRSHPGLRDSFHILPHVGQ